MAKLKSVTRNQGRFARQADVKIQRSKFDRSSGMKTTFDAGLLIPFWVDEALPGDTFNARLSYVARLSTPIRPVMDNIFIDTFFFAVPMRLLWKNWHKFNGAQDNPGDSTAFTIPILPTPSGGWTEGSFEDYIGLPTKEEPLEASVMWHRAYNLIFNQWFKSQDLTDDAIIVDGDGPGDSSWYPLRRRAKRHDYFTACMPWPQKGVAVGIGLSGTTPVQATSAAIPTFDYGAETNEALVANSGGGFVTVASAPTGPFDMAWNTTGLEVDLTGATAITVNALREAFQIQRLYERDARGGTRLTEVIRSHFGVHSDDARLQRAEYLGGGSHPIDFTPVAQTSTTAGTPQGNLAAFAQSISSSGDGFSKSFTEHCILIGLVNVRADLNYQQGLDRMFSRSTRWDFFWPTLAHLGEQAVLSKELFADGSANDEDVFGYQERYSEYRYKASKVTGQFRSNHTTPLDVWHLSQEFGSRPVLNNAFIEDNPPIDRIIATPSEPHIIFDSYVNLTCARPMPTYGTPGMIDHF